MDVLIIGLLLFLGTHSVRLLADSWRTQMVARIGAGPWKGLYSLASIAGVVLIVWGFGLARGESALLYSTPPWLRHLTTLFTLLAFVLVTAAYVPRNHFKAALGHPMLGGIALWAIGHLLAAGSVRDVVLFGGFLAWTAVAFVALRQRDRRLGTTYPPGTLNADAVTAFIGVTAWLVFALWLHVRWIGVYPFA